MFPRNYSKCVDDSFRWLDNDILNRYLIIYLYNINIFCRSLTYVIPELRCHIFKNEEGKVLESSKTCYSLVEFIMETLILSVRCLFKAYTKVMLFLYC